jgi:hypothetical protein
MRRAIAAVLASALPIAACSDPIVWPTPGPPLSAVVCSGVPASAPSLPLGQWFAKASQGPAEARVVVTVRATVHDRHAALAIELRNLGDRPIELWPHQLPWGNAYALDVVAIETDGVVLEGHYPIDDPGPADRIVLAPGTTLSGVSDLPTVGDLDARLLETDVILLWHYRLSLDHAESTTGVVTFPRRFHLRP